MPILPSGRRIDFSLDRFEAMLSRMPVAEAEKTVATLGNPDDLLFVTDVVLYRDDSGEPFFSGYLATDFESYVGDWSQTDQDALAKWIESDNARYYRAEAIDAIRQVVAEVVDRESGYQPMLQAA